MKSLADRRGQKRPKGAISIMDSYSLAKSMTPMPHSPDEMAHKWSKWLMEIRHQPQKSQRFFAISPLRFLRFNISEK
jgi:hypothetical protein